MARTLKQVTRFELKPIMRKNGDILCPRCPPRRDTVLGNYAEMRDGRNVRCECGIQARITEEGFALTVVEQLPVQQVIEENNERRSFWDRFRKR